MIAKRIMAPKGGQGFKRLGAYILNVRDPSADPASWTRLNSYILDAEHGGEKVAWARATNCGTDDLGWATKAIVSHNARNRRAKGDKGYHLVVSFPPGEKPTREQVENIEDRLCEAIGFGSHMRVSAVHQNTENWHLHVGISRIHPQTLHAVHPFRDHYRLQQACVALEVRHGLIREPHTLAARDTREHRTPDRPARSGELWHAYQAEREAAVRARDQAARELAAQHRAYAQELAAWYRERMRRERFQPHRGEIRRESFLHIAAEREKDRRARVEREREERRAMRIAHPVPAWQDYAEAHRQAAVVQRVPDRARGREADRGEGLGL